MPMNIVIYCTSCWGLAYCIKHLINFLFNNSINSEAFHSLQIILCKLLAKNRMSEKICSTVNKIGHQSSCPICLDNLSTPKTLFCLHTFCQQCLESLPLDPKHNLSCPTCQSPCELPSGGVAGLPTAFFVENVTEVQNLLRKVVDSDAVTCGSCRACEASSYCKQCNAFTCTKCSELIHNQVDPFRDHVIVEINDMYRAANGVFNSDIVQCSSHDLPLELYCNRCQQLVCTRCCLGAHRTHEYCCISDVYTDSRQMMETSMRLVEDNIPVMSAAVDTLCQSKTAIVDQRDRVKAEINDSVSELINNLIVYRSELAKTVDFVATQKLKTIDHQITEAKSTLSSMKDCCSCMKEVLTKGTPQQVLSNKQHMVSQSSNLLDVCLTDAFKPLEQPDIDLVKDVSNTKELIGSINYHLNLIPHRFSVSYNHLPLVGRESTVTMTLLAPDGSTIPPPTSSIQCWVVPPNSQCSMECRLVESGLGRYQLMFTPFVRGDHRICVTVRGNEVIGNNATVPVSIVPEMRGMPVNVIDDLDSPWGIDVTGMNQIFVSEWTSACSLITYHDDLKKQRPIGDCISKGTTQSHVQSGVFSHPSGVCATNRNTFIVSDTGNNRIQEMTTDGKCVKCVGSRGTGPLQFQYPRGIAIDKRTQQIYVADDENHRVQVLNPDFSFVRAFGSFGSGCGQFNRPRDIAFDSCGNCFITDIDNHRIQKFSPQGQCLKVIGSCGSKPGELNLPLGITIDDKDNLYVSESGNKRVSVFTGNGDFVCCFNGWGGKNCTDQLLSDPREIAFDNRGYLYVCDWGKDCVMVF